MATETEHHRKSIENIGHIVDHVTKSVEKQVRRRNSAKKKSGAAGRLLSITNKQKYNKLDEQDQDSVIEAIRNIGESSLIFTSPTDSPSSTPTSCRRKMGISETCEIQRKLVQKILKNYMITEHMKEYYFTQWETIGKKSLQGRISLTIKNRKTKTIWNNQVVDWERDLKRKTRLKWDRNNINQTKYRKQTAFGEIYCTYLNNGQFSVVSNDQNLSKGLK